MKVSKFLSALFIFCCAVTIHGAQVNANAMSGATSVPMTAIITPDFRISDPPDYLVQDFQVLLESSLIQNNIRVHNLQSVREVLRRHHLPQLSHATPEYYTAIGRALQVRTLIQCTITRFEVIETPYTVTETGASGVHRVGFAEGSVRVIATASGEVLSSIPFEYEFDFRTLNRRMTANWQLDDYYRYMTRSVVAGVVPELLKIEELN